MRTTDRLRTLRHQSERQWQAFVQQQPQQTHPSWLAQSWQMSSHSVSFNCISAPIEDPESVRIDFLSSQRHQLAQPLLAELTESVEDLGFAIGLSDPNAMLLWTASSKAMARRLEKTHFIPSAHWDEASIGTNAVGLAARLVKPVAVFSAEHYIPSLHEWVCYAAPIIHAPTGQVAGVLDISAPWQHCTSMALATVSHYAHQIAQLWSSIPTQSKFLLNLCGHQAGRLNSGTMLPKRLQEIFLTLALFPEGLHLEGLHAHVYGDAAVSMSTLKSEMTHLRQHIGAHVSARPYRLQLTHNQFSCDAQWIEYLALSGDVQQAMALYQHPLLPNSVAPAVVEYRAYLHQLMLRSLIQSNHTTAIWKFVQQHAPEYDVLDALLKLLPESDARRGAVQAKLSSFES